MKSKILVVARNGCSSTVEGVLSSLADVVIVDEGDRTLIEKTISSGLVGVCVLRSPELYSLHFDLLAHLKKLAPYCPVVVCADSATIDDAVRYIKHGAADFIVDGIGNGRFVRSVKRFLSSTGGASTEGESPGEGPQ